MVIGSGADDLYPPNETITIQINGETNIEGECNYIIYTTQAREIYINVEYVYNTHDWKQKIHAENIITPLKIYRRILNFTQWDIDNIPRVHITSDHKWDKLFINGNIKGQVIYIDVEDADDDL